MGCNCGKKLPKAARPPRTAAPAVSPEIVPSGPYRNATDSTFSSRNPRLTIQPDEIVELTSVERAAYTVKMAVRNGELVPADEVVEAVSAPPKKAAPKTAAPKTPQAKARAAAAAA